MAITAANYSISNSTIKTANLFSALDNTSFKRRQAQVEVAQQQQQHMMKSVAWTLKPIRSWADYDDEDDDEFFAHVAPLPSLPPLKPEAFEPEEEHDDQEEEEEETSSTKSPVQKCCVTAPPSKQVLTQQEQRRRHELAELDSMLAELDLTCTRTAEQWAEKEAEGGDQRQCTGRASDQGLFGKPRASQGLSGKPKLAATRATEIMYKPKKQKPSLPQEDHAAEGLEGEALRKVDGPQKGNYKRSSSSSASASRSQLFCKAAAVEASARAAKIQVAAKQKKRSQQQNYYRPR